MSARAPGAERLVGLARDLEAEIGKSIVGQRPIVRGVVIALLAGGHVLLEGLPGLGKTLLVRSLADAIHLRYSRIQFTPDLMPADVMGTNLVGVDADGVRRFTFQAGPIFANLVLADEINRATPKTQSALLEAMQEQTVTIGSETHPLPRPFFVLATQNPIELEGTYPLPEAELDRFFFKLQVRFPSREELGEIIRRTTGAEQGELEPVGDGAMLREVQALAREVPVASYLTDFAARLVLASHPDAPEATELTRRYVRYGASPRGAQALVLAAKVHALLSGRFNVGPEDLRRVAPPALRHRIILNFEAETARVTTDDIVRDLLGRVPQEART